MLFDQYADRLQSPFTLQELEVKQRLSPAALREKEQDLILKAVGPKMPFILLDERGVDLTSEQWVKTLHQFPSETITFVLGGAEGVTPFLRTSATLILSFGHMTWPHLLARVMLMEQLYRAQQIDKNHPYHRRL